jgi:DNA-binding SARP family transcriptional activator
MRFGVLGPVLVEVAGTPVTLSSGQLRGLLAALLAAPNNLVAAAEIELALWGENPPASARSSLYNQVMRLRKQLGPEAGARIRTAPPGYLIEVRDGELDEQVFTDRCAAGRAALEAGEWAAAVRELSTALALWRGTPGVDLPDSAAGANRVHRLTETRLGALIGRADAELRQGRHEEIIAELRALADVHPLIEAFHAQLMTALYRCGRQAEALDVYQELRRALVDELAVEPSGSVRELHRAILAADPELAKTPGAAADGVPAADRGRGGVPRFRLPEDTRVFTGRQRELDRLTEYALSAPSGTEAGMVVISAIDGMAGVGKTALALHVAHRVREQFPDGQLFVDLQGHTSDLAPLTAANALYQFLSALGVAPQQIPHDPDARAALYRDRLAHTRTLILVDNAASSAQIRPLIPRTPGCLVLITSRLRLPGLEDARFLALDVLSEADAAALLHRVAGADRVPAGHPAVAELTALCGRVPLAIRIAAARLRHRRGLSIEALVERLRDKNTRLGHLQDEERSLTAVFDSSYDALPADAQRMFRLLGLVPGPDFDAYAAAHLAGTDHRTAEHLLDSLLDHNLLIQLTVDHYRFHDLIRVYAAARSAEDPPQERGAALDRLLDYYERTAWEADRKLNRRMRPGAPAPASADAAGPAPILPDRDAALAWMRVEHESLRAALADATARGASARVIALTAALAGFLQREHLGAQTTELHRAAAAVAREVGESLAEANSLWDLGRVLHTLSEHQEAFPALEASLALYRACGDRRGEANVLYDLGYACYLTSDYAGAIKYCEQADAACRELGDSLGQADALTTMAYTYAQHDDPAAAADLLARAHPLYRDAADGLGEANTLFGLGSIQYMTGELPAAERSVERAMELYRGLGVRLGEANAHIQLGELWVVAGRIPAAVERYEQALVIYRELGFRYGESNAVRGLGRIRRLTGDYPAALELLGEALDQFRQSGDRAGEIIALNELGRARRSLGELAGAREVLEQALALSREIASLQSEARARTALACLRQSAGDLSGAAEDVDAALETLRGLGDRRGETEALVAKSALTAEIAGPADALILYRETLRLAREIHSPLDEAQALEGIARCTARLGDRKAALTDLRTAVELYERIGAAETASAAAFLAELEDGGEDDHIPDHPPGG